MWNYLPHSSAKTLFHCKIVPQLSPQLPWCMKLVLLFTCCIIDYSLQEPETLLTSTFLPLFLQKLKCSFRLKGGRSKMCRGLKWKRSSCFLSSTARRTRRRWRCLQWLTEGSRGRYPPSSPCCCSAPWWCWSLLESIFVAGTAVRPTTNQDRRTTGDTTDVKCWETGSGTPDVH